MPKKLILGALLAALLAVASVSLAFATSRSGNGDNDDVDVINLTSKTAQEADLDLGDQGPSVGDRFTFSDEVFRGGDKVGMLGGECVVVWLDPPKPQGEPNSVTVHCNVTVSLPHGQVATQGLVTFATTGPAETFTLPITGGTKHFRTAHGEVEVTEVSQTETRIKAKLILSD